MYSSFMVNTKSLRATLLSLRAIVTVAGCTEKANTREPTQTIPQTEPTPVLPQTTQALWTVPEPDPTPTAAAL